MLYLRKKLLGFACAALFGCAVGVTDEDALGDLGIDQASVFNGLDAGGALPSLASSDAAVLSTPAWSVPVPPAAPVTTSTSVPPSTSAPTSTTSTPAASTPAASAPATSAPATSSPPSTSTPPASSTSSDAGSATRDAGTSSTPTTPTPAPAPMCSPLKCNINCALLPRCCNAQNECMCLSPIRGCVLPPL